MTFAEACEARHGEVELGVKETAGSGAHVAGHLLNRHGLRWAAGPALALAAGGLLLLSHVPAHGSYLRDVLPGMLMAGFGLGLAGTAMAVGVLTGARHEEAGMLSDASATGHEIGGTLGIAIYGSILLLAAKTFLPKLRLNPQAIAAH